RDSNPRPSPWQGDALPTEPHPHFVCSVSLATRYNSIRRWRHPQNRSRVIVLTPADRAFRVGVLLWLGDCRSTSHSANGLVVTTYSPEARAVAQAAGGIPPWASDRAGLTAPCAQQYLLAP